MLSHYTVSQITQHIKQQLEQDGLLQGVWIQGEISNWSRSSAGHCYLTLKDAQASLRAVIWRSAAGRVPMDVRDGQAVLAHGRVSVYEPQGQYQFYIDHLLPVGRGALYLEFESLKARLSEEGLFDEARKRPLPTCPATIGMVTSPTGAALQDMLNILRRRWPLARVILSPTLVQGDEAPPQIVAALRRLYRRSDIDLIIVARGGGSMEDLWAFNDERVVRAIAESPAPTMTGIGHETDFTLADFVADCRAPTPSAAAELAVPDQADWRVHLNEIEAVLSDTARQHVETTRRDLNRQQERLNHLSPAMLIARQRQQIDDWWGRAGRAAQGRLHLLCERLGGAKKQLSGLGPLSTLERGYAIVSRADGQIVRQADMVSAGDEIKVRVWDGEFVAQVQGI